MKKIIMSSVVAAAMSVSMYAEGSKYYMGAGVNTAWSGTHTQERAVDFYSSSSSDYTETIDTDLSSGGGMSIKFGVKFESTRLEFAYSTISFDEDIDFAGTNESYESEFSGFDMDIVIPFTENAFKPYVMLGLGYYSWDGLEGTTSSGTTRDRSAVSVNYGLGLLYDLGNVELDIAYKGKELEWEEMTMTYTNGTADYEDSASIRGLYLGVNYHF